MQHIEGKWALLMWTLSSWTRLTMFMFMFPVKRLNKPLSDAKHLGRGLHLLALLSGVLCTDRYWPAPASTHIAEPISLRKAWGWKPNDAGLCTCSPVGMILDAVLLFCRFRRPSVCVHVGFIVSTFQHLDVELSLWLVFKLQVKVLLKVFLWPRACSEV